MKRNELIEKPNVDVELQVAHKILNDLLAMENDHWKVTSKSH